MTKMDIKLIALDMDGTLLNEKKELTPRTRNALERCIAQGILVVPAAGRIRSGIPREVTGIPGIRYAVTVNGAVVVDVEQETVIAEAKLSWEKAVGILETVSRYPVMYDCYIDGFGKIEPRFFRHLDRYGIAPNLWPLIKSTREETGDLIAYVRDNRKNVDKINLFFSDLELREQLRGILKQDPAVCVSSAVYNNLEINDAQATKGCGLSALAAHLGIDVSQIMAFGDGENDQTMIEAAGFGVAMGNAVDSLKAAADYVTLTNDEDGVAAAIEKFIFNKEEA